MDSNQQNTLIILSLCIQEFGAKHLIHHIYRHYTLSLVTTTS